MPVTLSQIIENLNTIDLKNEYSHFHFFLYSSIIVESIHRSEMKEFFLDCAKSEMNHIVQFGNLIDSFGGVVASTPNEFPIHLKHPKDIIAYAIDMENVVIENYAIRMDQCSELNNSTGKWIHAFIENQLMDSTEDRNNLMKMLRNN